MNYYLILEWFIVCISVKVRFCTVHVTLTPAGSTKLYLDTYAYEESFRGQIVRKGVLV